MADKRNVPEIRFKGFTEMWEQRALGEITTPFAEPVPTPKDGYWRLGIRSHTKGTFHDFVRPGRELETAKMYKVKANNFIVNITFAWEHAVAITGGSDDGKLVSHRFPQFCFNDGMVPEYFKCLIIDKRFKHHLWLSSPGGAGRNRVLKISKMLEYPFGVPNETEQTKIANFFQNIDSLITLHQRKYDKLTTVKKAMLEKMFPKDGAEVPEIRFKEFTEKWERQTLGEIVTEIRRPIELKDEHEYELVTVKRRNEGVVSRGKLKGKDILVKTYFELRSGDYIISKRQIVHGANGVVPQSLDKAIVSNEYLVAVGNERITTDFFALFSKLPLMYKIFFLSSYGIDIEKLVFDVDDWKKRYVVVPCLSEQQRISSFFQNLDTLIALQQSELDKLKNIKKACLEKMFV